MKAYKTGTRSNLTAFPPPLLIKEKVKPVNALNKIQSLFEEHVRFSNKAANNK